MRANYFVTVVAACCIGAFSACKKSDNPKTEIREHCIQITDINNGLPVADAAVNLSVADQSGNVTIQPGTSDQTGLCCIEIGNGTTVVGYEIGKAYYTTISGTGAPTAVSLNPEARLTVYVVNFTPSDVNDVMTLSYEHPIEGDSILNVFYGMNVDTAISVMVRPGANILKWNSEHMGTSTDSSYGPVNMYANHTVYTIVY